MKDMTATEREKNLYGRSVQIVSRSEEQIVYKLTDKSGDVLMTSYQIFPGVELIYNDVHARRCYVERAPRGNYIEINHCREGRIEFTFHEDYFYLTKGDFSLNVKHESPHESYFPLSHYHGVSVLIDLDRAPENLNCILEDINVSPKVLGEKFCNDSFCFIARPTAQLEHLFWELYSVPISIRKGFFKNKVLELLLHLFHYEDTSQNEICKRSVKKSSVNLAKNVCNYLTEHMESHITITELGEIFHVSQTTLKKSFKDVYGVSIYSFIRRQKMQVAALLLRQTESTVLEIAGKCGYDNGSKFAGAFKNVIGMTPNEYRNTHVEEDILHFRCLC
ncbi:MAG TPA: AraC family transcriptional regulator [Clostridium sp.]|nr:AraC family transcriptional regulator [Clostridium sp.]